MEQNKIRDSRDGIRITTSALNYDYDYKSVNNNIVLNVEDGIYSDLTNPIIKENIIYPNKNGLISHINSSPTYINNTIVLNNPQPTTSGYEPAFHIQSILKNNSFYILQGEKGMYVIGDSVINNIVTGNPKYGMWTQVGGVVKNNVIKGADIGIDHISGTPLIRYNDFWENDQNYRGIIPDSTNIYSDPMFVNEDSMDLHLQMYSPLIDAGDPSILDIDGSRSDIGLYGGPFGESYVYIDLPPKPPVNLNATVENGFITLTWDRNTEADTNHYNVYRDTVSNLTIDTTKLISSQTDTFYIQTVPQEVESLYYKITAVDNQGNESKPSEEAGVLITSVKDGWKPLIKDYTLTQNYPNPFNPSTKINYKLKERGYVKLYVYDIKGEVIAVLVNETQEAGYYEVEFSASSIQNLESDIGNLASGIYIYQIMVRNENNIPVFTDIGKMVLVK